MKSKSVSIRLDVETYSIAERLAKLSNLSVSELIKNLVKSRGGISEYRISEGVKKISGILKTDLEYKELRDEVVGEKIKQYERLN
jgi:hypothetical protein